MTGTASGATLDGGGRGPAYAESSMTEAGGIGMPHKRFAPRFKRDAVARVSLMAGVSIIVALASAMALLASEAGSIPVGGRPYIRSSGGLSFTVVIHGAADRRLARRILGLLEANADRITSDLGVKDASRYTVHVRSDEREFLSIMRQLTGASYPGCTGFVSGRHRAELLASPSTARDALHEYAHSVSLYLRRDWYNRPRWLWEAIAIFESGEFHHPRDISRLAFDRFPTLDELDQDFSDSTLIYRTGYLIVEFMKEAWGMPAVLELVRSGGDIPSVLGVSRTEFEHRWAAFVKRKYLSGAGR